LNYLGMNYIGEFIPARNDFESLNPCSGQVIGRFPQSTLADVNSAVDMASRSLPGWRALSRIQRAEHILSLCKVLETKIEFVSKWISLETGKSINESRAEVVEALHMAQYCFGRGREACGEVVSSELAERDSYVIRKPKGVVAVVAPWNFPFAIGGFWCAAPALLEGNTVVFKPSELTPIIGQITAELYYEAGFPKGVFNMIHGDGEVGRMLVEHENVNHIAFTGSVDVGRSIRRACANGEKTCSCEMGSKSAVMVFGDADLDIAVPACLNSAFKLSGQRCVSSGRLLVHRSILEEFKARFLEAVSKVFVGDPFEDVPAGSSLSFGPLISKEQMERVVSFNKMVRNDPDATVLVDAPCDRDSGYFLGPFVYQAEWSDKPYLKQEVFGPHVAIVPFDDVCDAIRIYNDTPYGLALGAITNDFRVMRDVRNWCDAGMIYFNLGSIGAESHLPFTGVKMSGNGGSSAAGTFDTVVHKVAVSVNHARSINFPQGLK
jgi:aldehyde dehydrogenase (NAD+)